MLVSMFVKVQRRHVPGCCEHLLSNLCSNFRNELVPFLDIRKVASVCGALLVLVESQLDIESRLPLVKQKAHLSYIR